LRDENFQGDCGQFNWRKTSWGSRVGCLACWGYTMLRRVILGSRRSFLCTAYIRYVRCTLWCHCICMWSQARTNFFLLMFLCLKSRLCMYCSVEKINPGHYFYSPLLFKRDY
jgi:hypothetical protein